MTGEVFPYLVKWRSLASMLRCLIHMRVSADPMSLVAPTGDTRDEKPVRTSLKLRIANTKPAWKKTMAAVQSVISST